MIERVLYCSYNWYQKEYLDISEDHSIANFLSVRKSTLLSHYWNQKEYLDINEDHSISTILSIRKSTLFVSLLVSKRVLRYKWRPLNSQLFEYWKDYSTLSHYWYQKYLDINEDHSISSFLSSAKSTLFVLC